MFLEILCCLEIQGIQLLHYFLVFLVHHLHLVFLQGPQVPFGQVNPCALDRQPLREVPVVQVDRVSRLAREVLSFQPLPESHSSWPEVPFFHQTLSPSGIPGLLAAVEVLEVLVHLAYLVHQALHRNPLSPAVQAFLCFHEVLCLLESLEVPSVQGGL